MFTVIVVILLLVIAAVLVLSAPAMARVLEVRTRTMRLLALIPVVIALVILAFSTTAVVEAKTVGVKTSFGKVTGTASPGLVMKAPWTKVTAIDATIQTDEYKGDDCITVILADKNTACISATNRWSVSRENAEAVYADFRSDDPTKSLRDAVVSTQFKAAAFDVFSKYDATTPEAADTEALAAAVKERMLENTDDLVNVSQVTISYIKLGEKAQGKIDAYQSQVAQTRIAKEKKATAGEEAAANKILSESISNDPNVLVSKCLDLIADGDFKPPAGFTCWPGGGTGVVIPGK